MFLLHAAHVSIDRLRHLSQELTDAQKSQYLTNHFRPSPDDVLHSHPPVTKQGRCNKENKESLTVLYQMSSGSGTLFGRVSYRLIFRYFHPGTWIM